jgi:CheY-like chemotaxis protein
MERSASLVVDDEPAPAAGLNEMLESLGYQVESLTSAIDAVEAIRHQSGEKPFDLVMTGMTMPHLTGADLARELLSLQPNLAILLCTGFSEGMDAQQAQSLGIHGFLAKTVVYKELARTVRRMLDQTKT